MPLMHGAQPPESTLESNSVRTALTELMPRRFGTDSFLGMIDS
ncbi:unnamed protein product [Mycetohabitans rhizoxinica HKI 454]|uniref:Uncharacterized protein n=1 Tax=Mycetohabitans rhizoxinica (strain DSM 19002 / CIP 109453 / HKI 454) TaxID=882378 RepID=E5ARI9_MYCRK|nr:unnamed protein product [Mycetohabitans rhizoxinica HKI 454]